METNRPARAAFLLGFALLTLAACNQLNQDQSSWARAALERNDKLSIVAVDKDANTFTVRLKDTGELRVVRADQVIATVLPNAGHAERPVNAASAAPNDATSSESGAQAAGSPGRPAAGSGEVARPSDDVDARYPPAVLPRPAVEANASAGSNPDVSLGPEAHSMRTSGEAPGDRASPDRKVLAAGPGYSIREAGSASSEAAGISARQPPADSRAAGVALEQRSEPIICQGPRLLHIDGRNLEFQGDAVSAEDGCEIHITNSHIIAHGVGVSANAASVHIKNSFVGGDGGSVSASNGAQVYAQSSTFKGLSRRLDSASLHDLGGNVWN